MKFSKGRLIVARARNINTLYLMHAPIYREELNVVSNIAGVLWHKMLGHMRQKRMHRLAEDNLIPEVKDVQLERCTDYLAGK